MILGKKNLTLSSPSMARRARKKVHIFIARAVISISSVLILILLYAIIAILIEAKTQRRHKSRTAVTGLSEDISLPDMAEMMKWGHGGSGVIIDSENLLQRKNKSSSKHSSVVWIAPKSVKEEIQMGYTLYGLNEFVSKRISLRRSLPDMRESACRAPNLLGSVPQPLPSASVIIVFDQEPRSVLLRTVFSVLDRSPSELLKEIILVDYGSLDQNLGHPQLENYFKTFSKKVRVLRHENPLSYADAVNLGAETALGTKLVVLSARSECTHNWLQPLLSWLLRNMFSIAVPIVDVIDGDTFRYERTSMSEVTLGSFSWDMTITRKKIQKRKKSSYATPEFIPVIADGIFAMDRNLFDLSGGLTSRLSSRDLVHLEFSFKSWMGGASIQLIPCSRVGLVRLPYAKNLVETEGSKDEKALVARWWLGDFKQFAFERLELKDAASAKLDHTISNFNTLHHQKTGGHVDFYDFRWFLQRLEPNKLVEFRVQGSGHLRQGEQLALTLLENPDIGGVSKVILKKYPERLSQRAGLSSYSRWPEFWYLTENNQLRTEDNICLYSLEENSVEENEKIINEKSGAMPRKNLVGNETKHTWINFLIENSFSGQARRLLGLNTDDSVNSSGYVFSAQNCNFLPLKPRWAFLKGNLLLNIPTQKCLETRLLSNSTYTLCLGACIENKESQQWRFSHTLPFPQDQSILDLVTSNIL